MTVHVVGNACIDLTFVLAGDVPVGATVLARRWRRSVGGKGLNQATAAARAGASVMLWAAVGDDNDAEAVQAHLLAEGIGLDGLAYQPGPTDLSTIWVGPDGDNRIVSAADQAGVFRPADNPAFRDALRRDDVVAAQGNLAVSATDAALTLARGAGARTALNPSPMRDGRSPDLALADLVVLNRGELGALTGVVDPPVALDWLGRQVPGAIVLTLGAEGAMLAEAGQPTISFAAAPAAVVDTTGAGDALFGTLVSLWAGGMALAEALPAAIRVAARAVERPGAMDGLPVLAEVRALIRSSNSGDTSGGTRERQQAGR